MGCQSPYKYMSQESILGINRKLQKCRAEKSEARLSVFNDWVLAWYLWELLITVTRGRNVK